MGGQQGAMAAPAMQGPCNAWLLLDRIPAQPAATPGLPHGCRKMHISEAALRFHGKGVLGQTSRAGHHCQVRKHTPPPPLPVSLLHTLGSAGIHLRRLFSVQGAPTSTFWASCCVVSPSFSLSADSSRMRFCVARRGSRGDSQRQAGWLDGSQCLMGTRQSTHTYTSCKRHLPCSKVLLHSTSPAGRAACDRAHHLCQRTPGSITCQRGAPLLDDCNQPKLCRLLEQNLSAADLRLLQLLL